MTGQTINPCPDPCIHPDDILSSQEVRDLAGIKSRTTLLAWRRDRGFPEPFKRLDDGRVIELYDRRAVQAWLDQQR